MNAAVAVTESSSVKAKAPLRITSPTEIRNYVQPTVKVYNPTDETDQVQVFGDYYTFPPKFAMAMPHKMRYLTTLDKNPMAPAVKTLWEEPLKVEVASEEIATKICSDEVRGLKGFTVLIGDGQDDERIAMADARWIEWRLVDAREREAYYVGICVDMARNAPGAERPRMKKDIKSALKWLKRYEAGEFRVANTAAQEAREEEALLLERRPDLKDLLEGGKGATARTLAEEAAAAESTVTLGSGKAILAKAKELGVKLRNAELEGITEGDPEVEAAVIKRLAGIAADRATPAGKKKR